MNVSPLTSKKWVSVAVLAVSLPFVLHYFGGAEPPQTDEAQITHVVVSKNKVAETSTGIQPIQDLPGVQKSQKGFEFDEAMKLQLQTISQVYEQQLKYPQSSRPIQDGELKTKYLPDIQVENELPAVLSDPNSPKLSVTPKKFRYFSGDDISAEVRIKGLELEEQSDVSARLLVGDKELATAAVTDSAEQSHQYQLNFGRLELNDVNWKQELTIEVTFQFRGHSYERAVAVEYVAEVAQLEDVAPASVEGEYLEIPVYFSTDKPGYHRLQANLYDQSSGSALVHLYAEQEISDTVGMLTLKAHITALKNKGSEGPYELRDIQLTRMPSEPDYITEFGRITQDRFSVDGFPFSDYEDKPYINEKAQRIANELRKLGS